MDLDTNAKRFKYSKVNKIICVLLCLVTFLCGSWLAVLTGVCVGASNNYEMGYSKDDWTNNDSLISLIKDNVLNPTLDLTRDDETSIIKSKILKNREKYINQAYESVQNLRNEAEQEAIDFEDYDYDEIQSTTYLNVSYDDHHESFPVVYDGVEIGYINISGASTKEEIAKEFDDEVNQYIAEYMSEVYWNGNYRGSKDCNYYISYKDKIASNLSSNFDQKDFYNSKYYIVIKHGKVESSGIDTKIVNDVVQNLQNSCECFKDIDLYFSFEVEQRDLKGMIQGYLNMDKHDFSNLYSYYCYTKPIVSNPSKNYIRAALFLVVSFIFGFIYFSVTGRGKKGEKSKLAFYDYIPFEIGLGVAGGIGFALLVFLFDGLFNWDYSDMLITLSVFAYAFICWIMLFMFISSNVRYFTSDKKAYKHFLLYWIFYCLIVGVKWLFVQTKKLVEKTKTSYKRTSKAFLYKPEKFKRNIILIAVLWLLINILYSIILAVSVIDNFGIFVVLLVPDVIFNFFAIRKVAEYVSNLDKIIVSASNREEINLDFEKLDNSLKVLAESMRYTNIELQNAINKAVKDERLRTELITNVSHDLKTPLTSIITYVDLLSKCDINDQKALEYINVLDEKGARLKRLIDDLIEASKVTSGNVTVNLCKMNLSELCLQATVDVQPDFEKVGLELVIKQGEKPIIVTADGTKTNRVIENLLSNARKYSAKGSRVYVDVYEQDGVGVFEIKNISAQALDITPQELTERFVRGDKSRNQDGNGLGLSIAKELCTLQNGELELIIDGDLFKAKVKLPK